MLQEDYDTMTKELEPLREEVEHDGVKKRVIGFKTQYDWLASKGIIRYGTGAYSTTPAIVYPPSMSPAQVSQRYLRFQDKLSDYMSGKVFAGKMGVKPKEDTPEIITKGEIIANDIPF